METPHRVDAPVPHEAHHAKASLPLEHRMFERFRHEQSSHAFGNRGRPAAQSWLRQNITHGRGN